MNKIVPLSIIIIAIVAISGCVGQNSGQKGPVTESKALDMVKFSDVCQEVREKYGSINEKEPVIKLYTYNQFKEQYEPLRRAYYGGQYHEVSTDILTGKDVWIVTIPIGDDGCSAIIESESGYFQMCPRLIC